VDVLNLDGSADSGLAEHLKGENRPKKGPAGLDSSFVELEELLMEWMCSMISFTSYLYYSGAKLSCFLGFAVSGLVLRT
jgi:hypothetical protein